ncbi:hypothetical protein EMIT0196MI5_20271 [Pseudomonas sp. IT-196MI5]
MFRGVVYRAEHAVSGLWPERWASGVGDLAGGGLSGTGGLIQDLYCLNWPYREQARSYMGVVYTGPL